MSLLPGSTHSAASIPIYATAGSGGGGGGGLNPTFSTVNMGGPLDMNNNIISLSQNFADSRVFFDAATNITYIKGLSTTGAAPGTAGVKIGTAAVPNVIDVADTGVGIVGGLNVSASLNVSSITSVSSINGAAYPPAIDQYADIVPIAAAFGGGPQYTPAAGQTALTSTFSVVAGHSYRITTTKVSLENADTTANQQFIVSGTGQTPLPVIATVSNTFTNAANGAAASQYSGTWRQQAAGPCQLTLYNNSLTQSTLVTCDSIIGQPFIIEDLGALI